MRWQCVQDFGFHKRGDYVVLPDDAEASPWYFVRAPEEEEAAAEAEQELAPDEAPEATEPKSETKKGKG